MSESNGRKEVVATHNVDRLIHRRPNPEMSAFAFRETMMTWALTWGNGYAEIERDSANRPVALWPISPDRVEVKRDDNDRPVYEISNGRGDKTYLPADKMFHLHGLGFDGSVGYSVINLARRSIGLGMAAEQFGASFFQNGTVTNLKIEHPAALGEQAFKNLKDSLQSWLRGPKNSFHPLIVEEGMKVTPLSMPMEDAQFLETRQFQTEEIARWFGLPPHKLQSLDKATFSNIEQQSIEVVTDALLPWAVRLEQEADYKLFSQRGNFYTKLNLNSLLRGDTAARATFYREMWNLGVFSVNEIRELEDMNPVANGDKRFVQLNMTTLDKAGEEPVTPPVTQPEEPDEDEIEARMRLFEASCRVLRRERHRVIDAAVRFDGNRTGFVEWMDKFFNQHREFIVDRLGCDETFAAQHENISRLLMLTYFDERTDYDVEDRANRMVEQMTGARYAA